MYLRSGVGKRGVRGSRISKSQKKRGVENSNPKIRRGLEILKIWICKLGKITVFLGGNSKNSDFGLKYRIFRPWAEFRSHPPSDRFRGADPPPRLPKYNLCHQPPPSTSGSSLPPPHRGEDNFKRFSLLSVLLPFRTYHIPHNTDISLFRWLFLQGTMGIYWKKQYAEAIYRLDMFIQKRVKVEYNGRTWTYDDLCLQWQTQGCPGNKHIGLISELYGHGINISYPSVRAGFKLVVLHFLLRTPLERRAKFYFDYKCIW